MPPDAGSPYLNQSPRTEEQARKDRLNREITEREIARRLGNHGAAFCRDIIDGALERIYSDDGTHIAYRDMRGDLFGLDLKPLSVMGEVE